MENGAYENIVPHLGKELDLGGLEARDELQVKIRKNYATNAIAEKPKPTCHHSKSQRHHRDLCRQLGSSKEQTEGKKVNAGTFNSGTDNFSPKENWNDRKFKFFCSHFEVCGNTNQPTERNYYGANAAKRPLPWKNKPIGRIGHQLQVAQNNITNSILAAAQASN